MPASSGGTREGAIIRARLEALEAQWPDMAEAIAFYRQLLPALQEAQSTMSPIAMKKEAADAKLRAGMPLLLGEELPLNLDETRYCFLRFCQLVEALPALQEGTEGEPSRSEQAMEIRRSVEIGDLIPEDMWEALLSGDPSGLNAMAEERGLQPELLRLLSQYSLRASFRGWAEGLKGSANWSLWQRGRCPICGSDPGLAELQGKERALHLRCTNCGADWPYPRIQCAFCGNDDPQSLHLCSLEGEEEKRQVQLCDSCRGYIKRVVTFDPTPVMLLQVEDLAALHLDAMAADRGFSRGTVQ